MEIGELIESTPWKHWKNIDKPSDIENIKIELVDIWHFLMSYTLQETNVAKSIISINEKCKYDTKKSFEAIDVINQSEDLMYLTLALMTNNCTYENEIENLISKFFKCCEACTLSFDELYNFYIGKNCLNKFRQDNGYKSGDYVKIWNKKEDNVVMMQILENSKSITFDELYLQLECEYKKI
jgi:dimeric dUTPase (all-alpha-NTP-PPase superfamily)